MQGGEYFARVKLVELKHQIEKEVGVAKAEKYFHSLRRFLRHKISPVELSKLASDIFGRGNVYLHNRLLISMLKNASLSKSPPKVTSLRVPNGYKRSSLRSLCKGRTLNLCDRKFRDRPSPLGPHGKTYGVAMESLSLGAKPPDSEQDREEIEQVACSPCDFHSRSPIRAPLGIPVKKALPKMKLFDGLASSCCFDTCHSCGELPGTSSLKMRLESKLEMEGLNVSVDCVNLLNTSVDVFLKRLIKPCLELAHSRSEHTQTKPRTPVSASVLDFRVAMELNPFVLGDDWPTQLEKICLCAPEE